MDMMYSMVWNNTSHKSPSARIELESKLIEYVNTVSLQYGEYRHHQFVFARFGFLLHHHHDRILRPSEHVPISHLLSYDIGMNKKEKESRLDGGKKT